MFVPSLSWQKHFFTRKIGAHLIDSDYLAIEHELEALRVPLLDGSQVSGEEQRAGEHRPHAVVAPVPAVRKSAEKTQAQYDSETKIDVLLAPRCPFFEFSLCLSRACLGKMFVFMH